MNSRLCLTFRMLPAAAMAVVLCLGTPAPAQAQAAKKGKPKAAEKAPAKPKAPGYEQHLAANMKLLNVLSRYADTLAEATDATSAALAVTKVEDITKEAISASEVIIKLGHPAPDVEAKLAKDADLAMTSRNVAEQTRAAVKALAANAEVKTILAPSIENFQAALNRIQEDAEDPQGPGDSKTPAASAGSKPAKPAASDDQGSLPAVPPSESASIPPPPAPPK